MLRIAAFICLGLVACKSTPEAAPVSDGTLLTPYLAIGSVLAADSIDGLPVLAAQVVQASEARMNDPGVSELVAGAGRVGAQDIATARSAYEKMSMAMFRVLAAHPEQRVGLMPVHCTMTFAGKGGYWVQREGEVMNPYEGSMMLHCGDKVGWNDVPVQ